MNLENNTERKGVSSMKQHQSSEDILTISVLQKELTVPSNNPVYKKELEKRLSEIVKPPPKNLYE
tara:strand:- start:5 stop:199 length:195 start_codon:yes stop_codon:yes gene_type:complete